MVLWRSAGRGAGGRALKDVSIFGGRWKLGFCDLIFGRLDLCAISAFSVIR